MADHQCSASSGVLGAGLHRGKFPAFKSGWPILGQWGSALRYERKTSRASCCLASSTLAVSRAYPCLSCRLCAIPRKITGAGQRYFAFAFNSDPAHPCSGSHHNHRSLPFIVSRHKSWCLRSCFHPGIFCLNPMMRPTAFLHRRSKHM